MRVVSWNVRYAGLETRIAEVASRLVDSQADIVVLQEVALPLLDSAAGLLENYGYVSHVDGVGRAAAGPYGRKPFGCMVASKWPAVPGPNDWRLDAPFPELFARAIVSAPDGPVDVTSVHCPNGSVDGWKKVAMFRVLAAALAQPAGMRRIVAGDFNEPKDLLPDGSIVTLADVDPAAQPGGHRLWTDRDGQTGDVHEWEEAVQAVLGAEPAHDLRDAHRVVNGGVFMPKTHFGTGHMGRWFDHILASPEFRVARGGVYSEWLDEGISDHAGVWARLA